MGQVLVLDVGMQPLQRVPWETAIVWILDRVVEVIEEYPEKTISTVSWSVQMPSIVKFVKPISRKRAIKFSRHAIYQRDKGHCQYCGNHVSRDRFTYDHVVPRAQGGQTSWTNVVVCCVADNQRKAGRTPAQAGMRLLSVPVKPKRLPDARQEIEYTSNMPESWRDYLRSSVYWNGTLDES